MLRKLTSIILSSILVASVFVMNTDALDKKVYSVKNTVQYENPITKELEDLKLKPKDKQYKSKKSIGDGMSRSAIGKYSLLDNKGKKKYLTLKMGLTDATKDYKIYVKNEKNDEYKEVKYKIVKSDNKKKTEDIKFEVPVEEAYIKISMFVEPMGRNVICFAQISTKDAKENAKEFNSQKIAGKMGYGDKTK